MKELNKSEQVRIQLKDNMMPGHYYQMTEMMKITGETSKIVRTAIRPWVKARRISKRENCNMRGIEYRLLR